MPPRTPQWIFALATTAVLVTGCSGGSSSTPSPKPTGSTQDTRKIETELDQLVVAKPASMAGYSRAKFPHWRSIGANCDVRDSVLKRDGTAIKLSGCNVVGGNWRSVYDDKSLTSPTQVDIDHLVPLANAWRSGAASWTTDQRGDFANDLTDPQLVAVSAGANRSKGDQDPSTWKPPATDNWCEYAQDWVAVKTHWKLAVTDAEKSALKLMLEKCR